MQNQASTQSNILLSASKSEKSRKVTKNLIILASISIPLIAGYIEYTTTYHFPKWEAFLNRVIITTPFSFGLYFSTLKWGKKYKIITAIIIFVSALIRSPLIFPSNIALAVFLIELYAIYNLFRKQ